jgi:hypothetical protein
MPSAWAQAPERFHWINFKQETAIVSRVSLALHTEDYSAIREIGLVADSALVFTTAREPGWATPEGDAWSVYSVSMGDLKLRKLVSGYGLRVVDWVRFVPAANGDLAITYLDCYECEPATLFTAFHYDQKEGWRVRWPAKDREGVAGVLLMFSDAGAPYTDEIVDQVWAVMAPSSGPASVGTWYRSLDPATRKVTSIATKFVVDRSTGKEESVTMEGPAAEAWERRLCRPPDGVPGLTGGQDSESCRRLFQTARPPHH